MAQVTPYFDNIRDLTYTVAATAVVGGTFVELVPGSDRRVQPAAAGSTRVVGVAAYDTPVGGKVKVFKYQMVPTVAPVGGVASGDQLVTLAGGNPAVAVFGGTTPNSAQQVVGQALESAPAGQVFRTFVF